MRRKARGENAIWPAVVDADAGWPPLTVVSRPIALTDHQLQLVRRAAASLPATARDEILRNLARRFCEKPSDAAVNAAIDAELALDRFKRSNP